MLPVVTERAAEESWRRRFETAAVVLAVAAAVQVVAAAIVAMGVPELPDLNRRLDLLVRQTGLLPGILLLLAAVLVVLPELAGSTAAKSRAAGFVVIIVGIVGLLSVFVGLTGVLLSLTTDGPGAVRVARPLVDLTAAVLSATAVWLAMRQGGR